jgi:hypothetical protein
MGQGLPLATIGGDLGQHYHFANGPGLKRRSTTQAVELEALCDKFCLSTRKHAFLWDTISRIQLELETRDLSDPSGKAGCDVLAQLSRGARTLPELKFKDDD